MVQAAAMEVGSAYPPTLYSHMPRAGAGTTAIMGTMK